MAQAPFFLRMSSLCKGRAVVFGGTGETGIIIVCCIASDPGRIGRDIPVLTQSLRPSGLIRSIFFLDLLTAETGLSDRWRRRTIKNASVLRRLHECPVYHHREVVGAASAGFYSDPRIDLWHDRRRGHSDEDAMKEIGEKDAHPVTWCILPLSA